jgi:hypothetical protein
MEPYGHTLTMAKTSVEMFFTIIMKNLQLHHKHAGPANK